MSLMMYYWIEEYVLININEADPLTGSALVLNLKPAFVLLKILVDIDKKTSWREPTVGNPHPRKSVASYFLISINDSDP